MAKYRHVVIVDDDPVSNFISTLIVKKQNLADIIEVADSVEKALRILASWAQHGEKPDLVLLDIVMPEKDGFQFMEEFNKIFKDKYEKPEIGVLTNSSSEEDFNKMLNLGAHYWINKPLKKEVVNNLSYI